MPDAGEFEYRDHVPPMQWRDALRALPLETAGPQAWEHLRGRLPARPSPARRRWPLWLAAAASLAVVIALPWRMYSGGNSIPEVRHPSPLAIAHQPAPPPAVTPIVATAPVKDVSLPTARKLLAGGHSRTVTPAMRRRSFETSLPAPVSTPDPVPTAPEADLEPLYAESARLEELVALTRDDNIANGGNSVLADAFSAELASIDAILAQPRLDASRRADLWHQRVDTLRHLAGIETTRRLLDAQGGTGDVVLVLVN